MLSTLGTWAAVRDTDRFSGYRTSTQGSAGLPVIGPADVRTYTRNVSALTDAPPRTEVVATLGRTHAQLRAAGAGSFMMMRRIA